MKYLTLTDRHQLCLKEGVTPEAKDDEICLEVQYCGICRTDAKMWNTGQRDLRLPRILGHEFCGSDSNQKAFTVWPAKSCGRCSQCTSGHENLCPEIEIIGFHRDGGMSEYVSVPKSSLIELPCSLSPELSIFAEPMACTINALEQLDAVTETKDCELRRSEKKTIIIIGGGTCGLLSALAAKTYNLKPVIIEKCKEKRSKSHLFSQTTNIEIIEGLEDDMSFDYGINAASTPEAVISGIRSIKSAGKFCLFSGLDKKIQLPSAIFNEIHYRQLTMHGAYGCTKLQMQNALKIIQDNQNAIQFLIEEFTNLENVEEKMNAILNKNAFRYIVKL
jgi:threonine dehydrogenase-like Zn-dependent dehydrogenase